MDKTTVSEVIEFLEECMKQQGITVSKIVLFGSLAKGDADEESDVDVAIISNDFKGKGIFQRAQMTKEPEIKTIRKFMVPLDIVTLTPEEYENETSLVAAYAKEGAALY